MRSQRIVLPLLGLLLAHCGPGSMGPSGATSGVGDIAEGGVTGMEVAAPSPADPAAPTAMPTTVQTPTDAGPDSAEACAPNAPDVPDDMGLDTNCDGADGVVGVDVYVDPTAGQDTNDGSPSAPFHSLGQALPVATARGGHILVAAGEIDGDSFPLTGSWSLYGGYTAGFVGTPDRQGTVFASSASGLLVANTTSAGLLAHVTVQAAASSDPAQPSVHVLKSRATHLTLHDVALRAPDAAGGATGQTGAVGAQGDTTGMCSGTPEASYALGQRYGVKSPDGTAPGTIDASGGQPANAAGSGFPGTDGQDAPATIQIQNDLVVGALGTQGQGNGTSGYGGAGGGVDDSWTSGSSSYTIWGGKGGNGGCPGMGGAPGRSGGTSVALVVLGGAVDISNSDLQAGFGADGGDGGQGGPGGPGGMGGIPELVSPAWLAPLVASCMPDNAASDVMGLHCAEYGGPGGSGGAGGHGGAGAGGWSIGILVAPGAQFSIDSATTITVKKPGSGGQSGDGGTGPAGRAVSSYSMAP